jgi:hypothetical protein
MTRAQYYLIKWKNKDAKGSVDLIDAAWLKERQAKSGLKHPTIHSDGSRACSTFDLVPDAGGILFCYGGDHAEANKEQGISRGDVRIVPAEFLEARELAWRREGHRTFEMLPVVIEEAGAHEGIRTQRRSTSLSRDSDLAVLKRAHAKANGGMKCETCGFTGHPAYGEALERCFEVHHKNFLQEGERVTRMDELALLCANCHNVIHALGDITFRAFLKRF